MGNALCLNKKVDDFDSIRRLSPVPSLKKHKYTCTFDTQSLRDVCVNAAAAGVVLGQVDVRSLSVLPLELLQLVLDHITAKDQLCLSTLQQLLSPWLDHLHLESLPGVDDSWMPVIVQAQHLRALDLSGCGVLTDTGAAWLSRLPQLTELKLRHCSGITDSGLCHISKLTQLKTLDVEGCEGLSSACLVVISQLQGLSSLNMTQCPGIRGSGLQHIKGLHHLLHLSLGWCRDVGDTRRDVTNNIAALAQLTTLRELSLAGTKVCDGQLAAVIPQLTNIQVLDLSGSCVTATGLLALKPVANSLRVIKLRGCQVGDRAGPQALSALHNVEHLDLSCSGIADTGLLCLSGLSRLKQLLLDMCRIGDEGCRVFRQLSQLQQIDLTDTGVTDVGVTHLSKCRQLAWLSLCNTEVGDNCAATLSALTCLTHLNLDARGITDGCLHHLIPLGRSLKQLDMYGARITYKGVRVLAAAFTTLEKLDLCGGHITDRCCHDLSALIHLQHLGLSHNRCLSDTGLRTLATKLSHHLEVLNISYTAVTDASIQALLTMKVLQVVVLSGSHITEAGVLRLKRSRPKLLVKATGKKV